MLRTHYRQPLDWTLASLDEAHKTLWSWYGDVGSDEPTAEIPTAIAEALSDDLNTPKVIAELHKLQSAKQFAELRAALGFLGFSGDLSNIERKSLEGSGSVDSAAVDSLIAGRLEARKAKNFAEADRIRDELQAMGIVLKDAKDPETGELKTTWEVAR
jgi:cysteinyl-tRNA synthetase